MDVRTATTSEGMTFHLVGRFTYLDNAAFSEVFEELRQGSGRTLVIDLGALEFIDSFGLGLLLVARDEAQAKGNTLVFRNPVGAVLKLFELADLHLVLNVQMARTPPSLSPGTARRGQGLRFSVRHEPGGRCVVEMAGSFTFADQGTFEHLLDTVKAGGSATVVLDMAELGFMDSAGLSMLLIVREEAAKCGVEVLHSGLAGQVRKLIELASLDLPQVDHGGR